MPLLTCLLSCVVCTKFRKRGSVSLSGCWPGARPGSDVWNSLYYTVREFPFSTCQLVDDDCEVDFNTVTSPSVSVCGGLFGRFFAVPTYVQPFW